VVLVLACAGAIVAVLAFVWAMQRTLMYFPDSHVPAPSAAGLAAAENVTFPTADGLELQGWFVSAVGRAAGVTVLVCNGNAGNRAHRAPLADALRRQGVGVFLFDYRGYGGNPGAPSETGLAADSRAARAYLVSRRDVDASRLVYFGESLGSAVAVRLATEHPPAALVLRSPFTSMADVGRYHYPFLPVRLLLRDRFPSVDLVSRIQAPLMVIVGGRDQIIPPGLSQQLYDAAPSPKERVVLSEADHNDYELLAGDEMIEAIVRFLAHYLRRAG
jgi:fermentation-respiration switch protein FrsA (DUF1100 family)